VRMVSLLRYSFIIDAALLRGRELATHEQTTEEARRSISSMIM